ARVCYVNDTCLLAFSDVPDAPDPIRTCSKTHSDFPMLFFQLITLCERFRFNLEAVYHGPVHVFAMSMTRVFWHFPTFLMPLILSERVPRPTAIFQCFFLNLSLCVNGSDSTLKLSIKGPCTCLLCQ